MIERYTNPEMGKIWSLENKFEKMKAVELAVATVQGDLGIIPKEAAETICEKSKFNIERIQEIEATTKHDVIAFVSNMAENVGPHGRYIHYAMTSSDVIDTALSLQVREAGKVLLSSQLLLENALKKVIQKHTSTLCSGRTHGIHAEPTTFGLKMAGHLAEIARNGIRLEGALSDMNRGKLSGAVGTYSAQSIQVEQMVCEKLQLVPEVIATQVIPRDRHAYLMNVLALMGGAMERLCVELRHLQRTEVSEVVEGFTPGQKGSSAMPHKKNPISAENITGMSRLLRSYAQAAMEDIALWHERDISHSSVERVIFPDAFIVCDYSLRRLAGVMDRLMVNEERMIENMDLSQGQLYSSHVLIALVKKGLSREEAYAMVQSVSHKLKKGEHLKTQLLESSEVLAYLGKNDIESIFSGKAHQKVISEVIDRVFQGEAK